MTVTEKKWSDDPGWRQTTSASVIGALVFLYCIILFLVPNPSFAQAANKQAPSATSYFVAPDEIYDEINRSVDRENIYRIELLVFADDYQQDINSEAWAEPGELTYQDNVLTLYDEATLRQEIDVLLYRMQEASAELEARSAERTPVTTTPVITTPLITPPTATADYPAPDTANRNATGPVGAETEEAPLPLPLLMVNQQDPAEAKLAQLRNILANRKRYRTLVYNQWYQSLEPKSTAAPVAIVGGRKTGERHELEGSVTLSKGRFLHITTDLWFIDWKPASNTPRTPWYIEKAASWSVAGLPDAAPHPAMQLLQNQYEKLEEQLATASGEALREMTGLEEPETDELEDLQSLDELFEQQPKPPRAEQVFTLNEYRRLKRDEIHYLDHPLFGVVVAISKW